MEPYLTEQQARSILEQARKQGPQSINDVGVTYTSETRTYTVTLDGKPVDGLRAKDASNLLQTFA